MAVRLGEDLIKQYLSSLLRIVALVLAGAAGQRVSAQGSEALDLDLAAAQKAQRDQNYPIAEQRYRAAIALAPDFAELHMNLGLVYQLQGRIPEAISELIRSLKLKPGLPGANLMLGIDLCKLGEGTKALPLLTAAVRSDPKRIEGYTWLATAQELTGDFGDELRTIEHALALQPDNADLQYLEGHTYERLGNAEVLRMNASADHAILSERLLGESYANSPEWPSAVLHFQRALAITGPTPGLHVELGEVLLRAGKLDHSIREFNEELRVDPHSLRALVRRGEAELFAGQVERALEDWTQALETDRSYTEHILGLRSVEAEASFAEPPRTELLQKVDTLESTLLTVDRPSARLALRFIASQHGGDASLDSASIAPAKVEPVTPVCSASSLRRGLEAGRLSDAAICGLRVLNGSSTQEFRVLVATSLFETGEYDASLQALSAIRSAASPSVAFLRAQCYEALSAGAYLRLYRTNPNSFRLHQLMADLAAARGDDRKAIEEYRAAILLKPAAPNLHYSLGHVLWKNSDIGDARTEFEAELIATPNHVGALHDLGETYLMERHPEQALAYLTRAVASGGKGPDLDRDLGTAYAQLGDYRNAEIEYNRALPSDHDGSLHFKLAKAYQALGEPQKASHEFVVAADLSRRYHAKLEEETPRRQAIEQ